LEIITPSYAADRELCGDLVRSIRTFAPAGTAHTVIVPARDVALFRPLERDGATVIEVGDVLPRHFVKVPFVNGWVNVRSPWPPVRGWIAQQIVKLEAVARSRADAVLVVDSDVQMVRAFTVDDFLVDGEVPLYRREGAVTAELPRHMLWDAAARRLLGLAPDASPQHPDYVCWPCLWQPSVVRAALARVEQTTRRDWASAIGRELHFSEMVLYGVYADEVASAPVHTDDMHCPACSDEHALDSAQLTEFLASLTPSDVAVMISAKSGTDLELRRAAIRRATGARP
jgi:hypothetical protein